MKITDPDIIKNGEKDLIDSIKEDLDLEAIKEILKNQIAQTVLAAKGGQIIVHDNQIAFQMDFDLNLSGSLIFDRDGNYIPDSDTLSIPEDSISEDINLDDVSIDNALEEIGPESDLLDISDDDLVFPEGEILGDETLPEELPEDLTDEFTGDLSQEELDDEELDDEELDIDLEEDDIQEVSEEDVLEDLLEEEENEVFSAEEVLEDLDVLEQLDDIASDQIDPELSTLDDEPQETTGEDDMDDILQESREFWEQKKDS